MINNNLKNKKKDLEFSFIKLYFDKYNNLIILYLL